MTRLVVEAVVATTHPLPAYGGVAISEGVLNQLAEALKSGRLPMFVQHDIRRPLDATILDSEVRPTADGHKDVWIRFEVDEDQWKAFDRERQAAGAPGGFSYSCAVPYAVAEASPGAPLGDIELAADAAYWDDDDLRAAAEHLRLLGTVRVARRYEFAHEPAAVVVLGLILSGLGWNLLANAIYDAMKQFLRPHRRVKSEAPAVEAPETIFHFRVQRPEGLVEARLETSDPESLRLALDTFDGLVKPRPSLYVWDADLQVWKLY